jgi:hypothetical protein
VKEPDEKSAEKISLVLRPPHRGKFQICHKADQSVDSGGDQANSLIRSSHFE